MRQLVDAIVGKVQESVEVLPGSDSFAATLKAIDPLQIESNGDVYERVLDFVLSHLDFIIKEGIYRSGYRPLNLITGKFDVNVPYTTSQWDYADSPKDRGLLAGIYAAYAIFDILRKSGREDWDWLRWNEIEIVHGTIDQVMAKLGITL